MAYRHFIYRISSHVRSQRESVKRELMHFDGDGISARPLDDDGVLFSRILFHFSPDLNALITSISSASDCCYALSHCYSPSCVLCARLRQLSAAAFYADLFIVISSVSLLYNMRRIDELRDMQYFTMRLWVQLRRGAIHWDVKKLTFNIICSWRGSIQFYSNAWWFGFVSDVVSSGWDEIKESNFD